MSSNGATGEGKTFNPRMIIVVAAFAAFLATFNDVALGSDAFFPFDDNIERARRSGVKYIVQPGGSIRDDIVIEACNRYGLTMAFTGIRLFHH